MCLHHNPSSQHQHRSAVAAAAAQPELLGPAPCSQQLTSSHEDLQAYAELQQQGEQQDDSSLQRLVVQAGKLPNQADQLWGDPSDRESVDVALVEPATRSYADLDYLSVSWAIPVSRGCVSTAEPSVTATVYMVAMKELLAGRLQHCQHSQHMLTAHKSIPRL